MTDIQAQHAPSVLAGELKLAVDWGRRSVGYLLMFRPGPAASAALAEVQDQVLTIEPALLRQPETQLHASVAWLLPVLREFSEPKDTLWARHGDDWLTTIGAITDATGPIRLRYQKVVAADAAIIAVAAEPNPVAGLRRQITGALDLAWPITYSSVGTVHTSLFRYRQPPADPAGLLRFIESVAIDIEIEVSELLMVRESVYPTLAYQVLQRLPLRGEPGAGIRPASAPAAAAPADAGPVPLAGGQP